MCSEPNIPLPIACNGLKSLAHQELSIAPTGNNWAFVLFQTFAYIQAVKTFQCELIHQFQVYNTVTLYHTEIVSLEERNCFVVNHVVFYFFQTMLPCEQLP